MTLQQLKIAGQLLSLSALSQAMGRDRSWLVQRIRRGAPELTADEQRQIREVLWLSLLQLDEARAPYRPTRANKADG